MFGYTILVGGTGPYKAGVGQTSQFHEGSMRYVFLILFFLLFTLLFLLTHLFLLLFSGQGGQFLVLHFYPSESQTADVSAGATWCEVRTVAHCSAEIFSLSVAAVWWPCWSLLIPLLCISSSTLLLIVSCSLW